MLSLSHLLTITTCFISLTLSAGKLGMIKDPDGFTNVRSGPTLKEQVVDTLLKDDFFYFDPVDHSNWVRVIAWKGRQIEGYVHASRVQEVEAIDKKDQRALIVATLERHKELAVAFRAAYQAKDSLAYRTSVRELEYHSDTKYDPILNLLPTYYCSTQDAEVMRMFFATMWADKGSANEKPSFSMGECFMCSPEAVVAQLDKIKSDEKRALMLDHIEWGLQNHFIVDEDGQSTNQKYLALKVRLDEARITP